MKHDPVADLWADAETAEILLYFAPNIRQFPGFQRNLMLLFEKIPLN